MLFTRTTPLPQLGLWTFEPAFSPRFSFPLSPRSFFHTRQRFPISNHVTSGWMSPRSNFDYWSAVSRTGSSSGHVIALDQSGASIWAKRARCTTFAFTKTRAPGRCKWFLKSYLSFSFLDLSYDNGIRKKRREEKVSRSRKLFKNILYL